MCDVPVNNCCPSNCCSCSCNTGFNICGGLNTIANGIMGGLNTLANFGNSLLSSGCCKSACCKPSGCGCNSGCSGCNNRCC
ncbi:MAG: hypothetical protein LBJ11_00210 [Oscillospiraceae bacterium]|nr:hypothetical protein [Oscillospiraceae bacterium]